MFLFWWDFGFYKDFIPKFQSCNLIFFSEFLNQFWSCFDVSEKHLKSKMADLWKCDVTQGWFDAIIDTWLSLSKQVWMLYMACNFDYHWVNTFGHTFGGGEGLPSPPRLYPEYPSMTGKLRWHGWLRWLLICLSHLYCIHNPVTFSSQKTHHTRRINRSYSPE